MTKKLFFRITAVFMLIGLLFILPLAAFAKTNINQENSTINYFEHSSPQKVSSSKTAFVEEIHKNQIESIENKINYEEMSSYDKQSSIEESKNYYEIIESTTLLESSLNQDFTYEETSKNKELSSIEESKNYYEIIESTTLLESSLNQDFVYEETSKTEELSSIEESENYYEIIESTTLLEPSLNQEFIDGVNNNQASPLSLVEFWIKDTNGNKVYEAVLKPGQSKTFELHNQLTGAFSKDAIWSLSTNRGTLSTNVGAECTFTAGSTTGTTTLSATLTNGTTYSIKIYITKTLDIIRPGDHATNPYGDISYEHIYVGASKTMRGNTVENRESNSDLLAYWTTGGHDDLVSRAWSDSRKCWTTQTITGLKAGTFTLAIKATTQNSVMAEIPVTVIEQLSPNRIAFSATTQKLRVANPNILSDVEVFCGATMTIKGQVGNYWYVKFGNYWGFLPKSSVYDYPYETYSGFGSNYYHTNRDQLLQVTNFNNGPSNCYSIAINEFKSKYNANLSYYQQISNATDVPTILIAAIHYREGSGNLYQSIEDGSIINTSDFVNNAIDTIENKGGNWKTFQDDIGMGKNTKNILAMMQFAEFWNGTGCISAGRINPYLYSGTNLYTSGKYTNSGWQSTIVDQQPGIYYLLSQVYS